MKVVINMLDIIICEDNPYQRKEIEDSINEVLKSLNVKNNIVLSTDNPERVIDYIGKVSEKTFIYFLDIELKNSINGVELAKIIRKQDPKSYIVFITSFPDLSMLTFEYKVQALDYIVKSDINTIRNKIKECFVEAYENYKSAWIKEENVISIYSSDTLVKLNLDDILFFETTEMDHKIRVHTFEEQIEFYGTLKELEKQVSLDYFKSHRSYLVNTKNIKTIDKKRMIINMINGEICYVSMKYLKGLIKKCLI